MLACLARFDLWEKVQTIGVAENKSLHVNVNFLKRNMYEKKMSTSLFEGNAGDFEECIFFNPEAYYKNERNESE